MFNRFKKSDPSPTSSQEEIDSLPALGQPVNLDVDDKKEIDNASDVKVQEARDSADREDGGVGAYDEDPDADHVVSNAKLVGIVLSASDDPSLPVLTFRFWFLGIGLATFGSVLSELYWWKPQGATVSGLFALLIAYVLGTLMAQVPSHGLWRWVNPGPFNIKEHAAITIMAQTASTTAASIGTIAVLDLYYGQKLNAGIAILQTWAAQLIGYGWAGILRTTLVYPSYALFPANLPTMTLLQSMHMGGMFNKKRMRFFWIVFAAIFCWTWIPTYVFPLLTAFSIVCLADRGRTEWVRNIFGAGSSNEGIGLFSFGFDWTLISQAYPLYWPLETQVAAWIGMLICYPLMAGGYYTDLFEGKSRGLPFMSTSLFTGNGSSYDQSLILTADGSLNQTAYAEYGQPYYTTTYSLASITHNLSTGASLTFVGLWYWKEIWAGWKAMRGGSTDHIDDVHFLAMKGKYREVPQWWFAIIFVCSLAIAIGTCYSTSVVLIPAWSVIVFTILSFCITLITGFLQAVGGFSLSTDGLFRLIAAFVHPEHPIANLYAVLFGNNSAVQALSLLSDMKLGQYAKIPPRATFVAQCSGTVLGAVFNYIIYQQVIGANRDAIIDPIGTRLWSGWNAQSLNSNALTWSLAGKLYTSGHMYVSIPAALGVGLLIPIPFWVAYQFFPNAGMKTFGQPTFKYLNIPVILTYCGWLPYSVNGMWWPGFLIGLWSQWYMRTRKPRWFNKYNYLLSAGLDGGNSVCYFIMNFALFGAAGNAIDMPYWWGNPEFLSADRCMST